MPTPGFQVTLDSNVKDVIRRIESNLRDQIPFVNAYALTKTAQDVRADEIATMQRVFDRPTRFTLNALYVRPATKSDQFAVCEFKEGFGSIPAWRYLGPQVVGGKRSHKSFEKRLIAKGLMKPNEFAVPASHAPVDAYGNVTGAFITRMLSMLGAQNDSAQNTTLKSKARAKARGQYLVLREDAHVQPGVYHRKGARGIEPVFIFTRPPTYRPRFPFYERAQIVTQQNYARRFAEGWGRYVTPKLPKAA